MSQSAWLLQYDPALKLNYYKNPLNGSIRFDSPHEVVNSSSSAENVLPLAPSGSNSSFTLKKRFSFLPKLSRKLSLCNRSKSRNTSSSPSSTTFVSAGASEDSPATSDLSLQKQLSISDNSDAVSMESYVSSVDESIVNANVNKFYGFSKQVPEDGQETPYYTYYSHNNSFESTKSLTIMNPDEFKHSITHGLSNDYVRDNIDDYDSDIESLHEDPVSFPNSAKLAPFNPQLYHNQSAASSYNTLDTASDIDNVDLLFANPMKHPVGDDCLLFKQLGRELLRYEEDLVQY